MIIALQKWKWPPFWKMAAILKFQVANAFFPNQSGSILAKFDACIIPQTTDLSYFLFIEGINRYFYHRVGMFTI